MAYGRAILKSNVVENWLFAFSNRQGGAVYIAFKDTVHSNNFYHGVIKNRPSIRESIDLKNSTSKTSNISITIADYLYKNKSVSKELFGGSNDYINQSVTVHSQIDSDTPQQIGSFRLVNIVTDGKTITLSLATQRPFNFIQFPQDVITSNTTNTYVPVVYGDYTPNNSFKDTPAFCDTELFPVPTLSVDKQHIRTLMPRSYSTSDNAYINLYQGDNVFLPFRTTDGTGTVSTDTYGGHNVLSTPVGDDSTQRRNVGIVSTNENRKPQGSGTEFSNTANAFDGNDSTVATVSISGANPVKIGIATIPKKWSTHDILTVEITGQYTSSATFSFSVFDSDGLVLSTGNFAFGSSGFNTAFNATTNPLNRQIGQPLSVLATKSSGSDGTFSIQKIEIGIDTFINTENADDLKRLGDEKFFYSGADGLTETYSGSSAVVTEIHEAHRDLLTRFAGLSTTDPSGWSDLQSAKDWKVRYWKLEPTSLQKELEKLQKEGGFIFRFRFDGSAQYIFVKDSYGSADVTFSKSDIANIKVMPTAFSDLITSQEISYRKHPAKNEYRKIVNASNSTTRTDLSIQTKENIESVNLDYYVSPDIPSSPSSNPNDDYYSYYDHLFGEVKLSLSFDIINTAKWADSSLNPLEVGSIVDFDNANMFPETPFGYNSESWTGIKFMIVDFKRDLGKISVTVRQIT